MEHLYSKFADEHEKVMGEIIIRKITELGQSLPNDGTYESLLLVLREFYQREANRDSIEWLINQARKVGYSFSIDYTSDYCKYEYGDDGSVSCNYDPTKIKLAVTYKVISI
ncbi:hypothetical protein [Bacillus mycoides]|uniref:hypothetical protein n=1 Tax=Bacillus mycoides TaxID=1405 RepID=UPI00027C195B|nr:hypothetical protein [Bacillus mycoides]EJV59343.1 hypothetical protein IEU_05608 [Bacillus mycoides]